VVRFFTDESRAAARLLSSSAYRFLEHVETTPTLLEAETFEALEGLPRNFPLQPWPLFVSTQLARRAATAARAMFDLLRRAPRRAFSSSPADLGRYYRIDEPEAALRALELGHDARDIIARADLAWQEAGFKLMELNCSGALGGWDSFVAADVILGVRDVNSFVQASHLKPHATHPLFEFLEHAATVAASTAAEGPLNLAVLHRSDDPIPEDAPAGRLFGFVEALYQDVLRRTLGRTGKLTIGSCDDVEIVEGAAMLRGERQHVLLEFSSSGMTATYEARLRAVPDRPRFRAFNGPETALVGDKRTMALVWRLHDQGLLGEEEARAVRSTLPWTALVGPGMVRRGDTEVDLLSLLGADQQRMVLKRGSSDSGRHVVIGAEATAESWASSVRLAREEGDWIVQELVPALALPLQHGEQGWAPHRMVWGAFVFGARDGGAYGRASPVDTGMVVNSGRGARDVIIFEVDDDTHH
jgi:hypothetical protein